MANGFARATVVDIEGHRSLPSGPRTGERITPYSVDLRIDGWFVQPSLNLLTRGNVQVRLRAQLMDVLVCLANRPGKVFRKEELVAEVWDGRWVAASALSRCMSELRAALGDDARQPQVIETITKRGYRLIAPVEVFPGDPPAPTQASPAPDGGIDVSRHLVKKIDAD